MPDHFDTALHLQARARRMHDEEERADLLALARTHLALATGEARAFIRAMAKRPPAASVRRAVRRKRA
jgi:hypothetical protein